ncbi:hypothetical protein N0V82_010084 [Gnomoniopsis sp. IMI 355080]|nr:hypothetical protein N0V82_010084 [Gnomoniopsis sp. IMI 355080]
MDRLSTKLATLALLGSSAHAFRFLGRVNPSTQELSWPATGLAFSFNGTSASVNLAAMWGTNSIEMVVDGGAPIVTDNVVASSIDTPTNLSEGYHTVEIRKKSEALYGSLYVGNVTAAAGGTLGEVAAPATRIQIIGDSISVGYGLDGTYPCVNSAALEDAPKTYGALTAQNLSADYDIIAWSGKGLIRNYPTGEVDDTPIMPELWTRYGANDADNSYTFPAADTPDIVVINLGTNDFDYMLTNSSGQLYEARDPLDPDTYTAALVNFTTTIQGHYPDAQFFITSSPLLSDGYPMTTDTQHTTQSNSIQAAVAEIGSNAHFVNFPTQDSSNNNIGCDYHPSAATHQSMAVILTAAIEEAVPSLKGRRS